MPYDWGPHYMVPSKIVKNYSSTVILREQFNEELLHKELDALKITGPILRIANPWYYRKKGLNTWIKIGESEDRKNNFPVKWVTRVLENGQYEILGLMHVYIKKHGELIIIARQNIIEVTIKN